MPPQPVLQPTDLERSIFRTLAWFSLSEYPVTSFEIWKWLLRPTVSYHLSDVLSVLQKSLWLAPRIERAGGFFVLRGQTHLTRYRHDRGVNAARKYKRLALALKYFTRIPTVKAVAACNTLAWSNTTEKSDIDLFIVTSSGRIWITRLLIALPFAIIGLRPRTHARDPFCFSFFVTERNVDLTGVRLHAEDIYLASWIRSLVPVFDRGVLQTVQRQNRWVHRFFPNAFAVSLAVSRRAAPVHPFVAPLGFFEAIARVLQQRHLPTRLRAIANKDTRVVIQEDVLKFHDNDRREEFYTRWQSLCLNAGC